MAKTPTEMPFNAIDLPLHVVDLLTEAGDELEVVLDEITDAGSGGDVEVADGIGMYFGLVRHQLDVVLERLDELENEVGWLDEK